MKKIFFILFLFSSIVKGETNIDFLQLDEIVKKESFYTFQNYTISTKITKDQKVISLIHKPTKNFSELCKKKETNNGLVPDYVECFDNYNLLFVIKNGTLKINFFDFYGRSKVFFSNSKGSTMSEVDAIEYITKAKTVISQK